MRRRGTLRSVALIAATVTLLAACSHTPKRAGAPAAGSAAPRPGLLVTVGSNATFGDGIPGRISDSWPQRFYHEAFPRSTVLINAADEGATVDQALADQVPLALQVHATVVTVWLGDIDLAQRLAPASFEADLGVVVRRLRASRARVLIANLSLARPGAAAYDAAIARVARAQGATLVDLASALVSTPAIGPSSSPVSSSVNAEIAHAFTDALARS